MAADADRPLPRRRPRAAVGATSSSAHPRRRRQRRHARLHRAGCSAALVGRCGRRTARPALARAARNAPDVVLTDVMMPGLDGFELLRALRADERTRAVPVILLSARAGEEARVEGLRGRRRRLSGQAVLRPRADRARPGAGAAREGAIASRKRTPCGSPVSLNTRP